MVASWAQYALLVIVWSLASPGLAAHPYPLGIHFGPTNISAALIQDDGEPLLVAHITATEAYHQVVAESVRNMPSENLNKLCEFWDVITEDYIFSSEGPARVAEIEAVFTENLLMIRDEVSKVLEKPVDISSISAVNSFNGTVRQAVRHSVAENLEQELPYWRVGSPEYGAFYRYDLNVCQGSEWMIQDDDFPIEVRYALSLDYNYEYLDVYLNMAFCICLEEYNSQLVHGLFPGIRRPNLGTRRLNRHVPKRFAQEIKLYNKELQDTIYNFIAEHFPHNHPSNPKSPKAWEPGNLHIDFLKAIIISGEAPKAATDALRTTIVSVLPGLEDRFRDEIEPNWVGAVGAAQLAKVQIDTPSIFEDTDICFLEPEDIQVGSSAQHDEL